MQTPAENQPDSRISRDERRVTIRKLTVYRVNGRSVSKDTPGAVKCESANWYLFGRDLTGKQVRKATGSANLHTAERMARELEVDLDRGLATADNIRTLRYEDIREDYVLEKPKRAQEPQLKIIDAFFKGMKVPAIGHGVRKFIARRRAEGISDATIKRDLKPLRTMLNLAAENDRIPKAPKFPKLSDGATREGFIEVDVFNRLRDTMPARLRPLMTFCYYTGCRIGAARKITWGMVNRPACDEIFIPGRILKNGKPQGLPLFGPLEEVSTALKNLLKEKNENGSIKLRANAEPVFDATNLRKEWNIAVAALGLGTYDKKTGTRTGLTIHDFRRSCARNLRKAGVDEATAMTITGHKTASMFKRYAITADDDTKDALIRLGDYAKKQSSGAAQSHR